MSYVTRTFIWDPVDEQGVTPIQAIKLIMELGRLRPGDTGTFGLIEAKRIYDRMAKHDQAVSFTLPKHFADILTPIFDRFFSSAREADVSTDEICRAITLERLRGIVEHGVDPVWG